ncbi:hypothetical protein DNK06_11485 [Pseudomonas daroniae]|uniref:PPM-type phosphatase domain-containing protein n=1 Tax=Phytopseudomonas daroniae TaxID=2487519 RepID=A0A4Q9QL02_9GAMM|nr:MULTISPECIES: PP2C family serine/threonine-protein phosphatase [Pseudomonas]TBU79707.1 hypothetical protein DNK06_11485 [Pseudomonas daroniae]TBU82574.1 hypothetical protein DNK31_11915 [Pseudomonas sp. FRB 228]TBU91713.1 hypothetical protein DNJ99_09005 [Pseudomonas daroniae]
MNSLSPDFTKTFNTLIGRELYSEIGRASWDAMPPITVSALTLTVATTVGSVRKRNEDRVAVAQVLGANGEAYFAALVCDGVGGSEMGDVAASMAVATFLDELAHTRINYPLTTLLTKIIRHVDNRVRDALQGKGATTISCLIISSKGEVAATNIGDSRIYAWAPHKERVKQLSRDDTLENELSDLSFKDPSALRFRGLGGSLSQAIGETTRTSDDLRISLLSNEHLSDGVVLATDGVWKSAEDGFNAILRKAPTSTTAVSRLLSLATWAGGVDNASIIAIESIAEVIDTFEKPSKSGVKISVWLGNTKIILSGDTFQFPPETSQPSPDLKPEHIAEQPSELERKDESKPETPIMKSDIRKVLIRKYGRTKKPAPPKPEQLDFKIADDSSNIKKKEKKSKIEITIDSGQNHHDES